MWIGREDTGGVGRTAQGASMTGRRENVANVTKLSWRIGNICQGLLQVIWLLWDSPSRLRQIGCTPLQLCYHPASHPRRRIGRFAAITHMTFSQRLDEIRTGFERPFWVANITEL